MTTVYRLLIICGFAVCLAADTYSQTLDVYLFGGQSNQQGIAELQNLDDSLRVEMPRVLFWNGENFENLNPGVTRISTRATDFGPEIGFAHSFLKSEDTGRIAIIKHWRSGIALSAGWDNQRWLGETPGERRLNFYPGLSPQDDKQGAAYQEMIQHYRNVLAHLDDHEVEYSVKGLIGVQGEQDAKNRIAASNYAQNLVRMVERVRKDLSLSDETPIYFAQSLGMPPSGIEPGTGLEGNQPSRFPFRSELRESMAHADSNSDHPESIAHAHLVLTDGLSLKDDVHYDASGQLDLGARFYSAIKESETRSED